MTTGYQLLTEKEKQTLRLLLTGYDAKSMARHLGLSVHTVHERLRDARRKMATSSSREAARLLREVEEQTPELLGDKPIGAASTPASAQIALHPGQRPGTVPRAGWTIGGVVMTMAMAILAALALASGGANDADGVKEVPAAVDPSQQRAEQAARQFLALVDARNWQASYAATGGQFRKNNTLEGWSKAAQGAHGALGSALSRELVTADYSPAPPNGVWNIRFRSRFAGGREVVETLALSYEDGSWRVVGLLLD
jgi:DNA-binding CsgD family transcriptional regulator